jgi:hypothetical protein
VYDETLPALTVVSIASDNADPALAKAGDTVTLSITASETLSGAPVVQIAEQEADSVTGSGSYTATRVMQAGDPEGVVVFSIDFVDEAGNAGATVSTTTDASSVVYGEEPPVLWVSPTVLDFGETEETLPFYIENIGEGILHWEICYSSLSVNCCSVTECTDTEVDNTISGSTTTESDEISVTVSRIDKPGSYQHLIDVNCTDNGDVGSVTVNFVISDTMVRIYGYVTDADTEDPLEDVNVVIEILGESDRATSTDADGFFEFLNVPTSIQSILGYKSGYADYALYKIIKQPGTDWDLSFQMTEL